MEFHNYLFINILQYPRFPQQTFIFQTITSCVNVLSTLCKRTKFCGSLDKIEVPCHSRCGTIPVTAGVARYLPVTAGVARYLPVTAGVARYLPVLRPQALNKFCSPPLAVVRTPYE